MPALRLTSALSAGPLVLLGLLGSSPAHAHGEVIERVVAVVEDDAILLSELRQRAVPRLADTLAAAARSDRLEAIERVYREELESMIDDVLLARTASAMGVGVDETAVDAAIERVRQQAGLSPADFLRAVQEHGYSFAFYRAEVRRQLLRLRVVDARVRARVNVTEAALRARYARLRASTPAGATPPRYRDVEAGLYRQILEEAVQAEAGRLRRALRRRALVSVRL